MLATFLSFLLAKIRSAKAAEEVELMLRIAGGDVRALDQLYQRYSSVLFGTLLSIVKKREEAEDLLQEVFVLVWDKAKGFDAQKGNVYTWMTTLTRNKAIDCLRSKGYRNHVSDTSANDDFSYYMDDQAHDPLDSTLLTERAQLVRKALSQLPAEQEEVLRIAYFKGLSQAEIADELALPLGTVKTRMRQGMKKLEASLKGFIQ